MKVKDLIKLIEDYPEAEVIVSGEFTNYEVESAQVIRVSHTYDPKVYINIYDEEGE